MAPRAAGGAAAGRLLLAAAAVVAGVLVPHGTALGAGAASVSVSDSSPLRGSTLTVTAADVPADRPGGDCVLWIDASPAGNCEFSGTSAAGSLTVPASLRPGSRHEVEVCVGYCAVSGDVGRTVGAAEIGIPDAVVRFAPSPLERGRRERISGSGFVPGEKCYVKGRLEQAGCDVTEQGEVTGSFLAPATGDRVDVLVCQGSRPCADTFTGGYRLPLVDPHPRLTAGRTRLQPGDTVDVRGAGFLPGGVQVTAWGVTTPVDDEPWGDFTLILTVPSDAPPGRSTVEACSAAACAQAAVAVGATGGTGTTSGPTGGGSASPSRGSSGSAGPSGRVGRPPGVSSPPVAPTAVSGPVTGGILLALVAVGWLFSRTPRVRLRRDRRWVRRHLALRIPDRPPLRADPEIPGRGAATQILIRPHPHAGEHDLQEVQR
jgi:hypothetical protein